MNKDVVKEIRKATRRRFSSEEKIKIVLEGLQGEISLLIHSKKFPWAFI